MLNMRIPRSVVIGLLIVVPALLRAPQMVWNIVPMGALALFCGAHFRSRLLAFAIPMVSMFLGNLLLGFATGRMSLYVLHPEMVVVYACYAVSVGMGIGLQRYWGRLEAPDKQADALNESAESGQTAHSAFATHVVPIALTTVTGSVLFFLLTNLASWYALGTYAPTASGLMECYWAAIPFFRNGTLPGDAVGSLVLFGGEYLLGTSTASAMQSERI
jgi:hypothetical protein